MYACLKKTKTKEGDTPEYTMKSVPALKSKDMSSTDVNDTETRQKHLLRLW